MSLALTTTLWVLTGLPATLPLLVRQRWALAVGAAPFAGGLALMVPWEFSALTGVSVAGGLWAFYALLSSALMGSGFELVLRLSLGRGVLGHGSAPLQGAPCAVIRALGVAIPFALVLYVTVGYAELGLSLARGIPPFRWDGYAIWLLRTRALAGSGVFAETLGAPGAHEDYPMFLPALYAFFQRYGGVSLWKTTATIGMVTATLPLAAFTALVRHLGGAKAGLVVVVPFAVPQLVKYQFGAYADPTLVMTGLYGMAICLSGVRGRDSESALAGAIVLAACASVKNEGALWVLACGVTVALLALDFSLGWRRALRFVALCLGPAALFFLLWTAVKVTHGLSTELLSDASIANACERSGKVIFAMGRRLLALRNAVLWIVPLAAMLALAVVSFIRVGRTACTARQSESPIEHLRRQMSRCFVLLVAPVVYYFGLFVIYLVSPADINWHLATSLDRVSFIVPPSVLVLATFADWGRLAET